MKCRDVKILLVELADGTISAHERKEAELHLAACASCAADAALLTETFAALRDETEDAPPDHYFTNLLPKIRRRLEQKQQPWHVSVPLWINKVLAPVTVTAMAVLLVGLFRLLEPTEEFTPLNTIISQVSTDDIVNLVASETEPFESNFAVSGTGRILEVLPNANRVADNMKADLLAGELSQPQTELAIINDDTTLEEMDDDAVSQVLNRMSDPTTL